MKIELEFISVKDRLPEKSGNCFTVDVGDNINTFYRCEILNYSAKHKAFNAFDSLPNAKYKLDVDFWAEMPETLEEKLTKIKEQKQ